MVSVITLIQLCSLSQSTIDKTITMQYITKKQYIQDQDNRHCKRFVVINLTL
jgi:hypothetical protein